MGTRIPLRVEEISAVQRVNWPVTSGVPLKEGMARREDQLAVFDANGQLVPCQFRTLARWPDGSIKWVLLDFQANIGKQTEAFYFLETDFKGNHPATTAVLEVCQKDNEIHVDTGCLNVTLQRQGFNLFQNVALNGRPVTEPGGFDIIVTDKNGTNFSLSADTESRAEVEESGPLRVCIKAQGHHQAIDGTSLFDWVVRMYFYAGQPYVKAFYTFINREEHPQMMLGSVRLTTRLADQGQMVGLLDIDWKKEEPDSHEKLRYERFQSEGFEQWGDGGNRKRFEVYEPCHFGHYGNYNPVHYIGPIGTEKPHELNHESKPNGLFNAAGELVVGSNYCNGWADISNGKHGLGVAFLGGMHLHPKAFHLSPGQLDLELIASEDYPLPINMGVAKTHTMFFCFHDNTGREANIQSRMLGWIGFGMDGELHINCPGDWFARTRVCGDIMPYRPKKYPELENFLRNDFVGKATEHRGEGVLHFGDFGEPTHRDHVSGGFEHLHDDLGHSMLIQFQRTGEMMYRELGEAAAMHLMDVDVMHRVPKQIAELEGCPRMHYANEDNRFAAALSHAWLVTLLTYYYTSGYQRSLEIAIAIADAFVRMVEKGYTRRDREERTSGWCLTGLMAVYRATSDEKYLKTARTVIDIALERQTDEGEFPMPWSRGLIMASGPALQTGALLTGMKWYHEVCNDDDVREALLKALDFAMTKGTLPEGYALKYTFGNGLYKAWREASGCESMRMMLPLAYAYKLTGDRKYVEHGLHDFHHRLNHAHFLSAQGEMTMYVADTLEFMNVADELELLRDLD